MGVVPVADLPVSSHGLPWIRAWLNYVVESLLQEMSAIFELPVPYTGEAQVQTCR